MTYQENELINTGAEIYINTALEMVYLNFEDFGFYKSGNIVYINTDKIGYKPIYTIRVLSKDPIHNRVYQMLQFNDSDIVEIVIKKNACFDIELLVKTIKDVNFETK